MNEIHEALKGFTDMPIALICILFGVLSGRIRAKKYASLYFCIAPAAVLGAVVHIFRMPPTARDIVWVVLYPLLYESVRRFTMLFTAYITGREKPESRVVLLTEAVLCLLSIGLMLFLHRYDMLVFLGFGALCVIRIAAAVIASRRLPWKAGIMLAGVPIPLLLQAFSERIPYAVVYEHIAITALLFVVYLMARDSTKS